MFFEELLKSYESGKINKSSPLFVVAPRIGGRATSFDVYFGKVVDVRMDEISHPTYVGHNPVELSGAIMLDIEKNTISSFEGKEAKAKICNHRRFIRDNNYFTKKKDVEKYFEEEIKKNPIIEEILEKFFSEIIN